MTALQKISQEAKRIYKANPKLSWTDCIKKASLLYAKKKKNVVVKKIKSTPTRVKKAAVKKAKGVIKNVAKKIYENKNLSGTKLQKGELVLRNKRKTISENKVLSEIEKVKKDILALEKLQKDHITKKHKSSIGAVIRKKHTNIKALLKNM